MKWQQQFVNRILNLKLKRKKGTLKKKIFWGFFCYAATIAAARALPQTRKGTGAEE
jgi:hypothetical protein